MNASEQLAALTRQHKFLKKLAIQDLVKELDENEAQFALDEVCELTGISLAKRIDTSTDKSKGKGAS